MDVLDDKALRKKVQSVVEVQRQVYKEVLDKVQANGVKRRVAASRGNLPICSVGEYVLVACMRHSGSTLKLMMTWTKSWRVAVAPGPHAYGVQEIVSGKVRDIDVARMRFLRGRRFRDTAELKKVFQHAFTQEEFEMAAIVDMANAENGSGFEVEEEWVGFDKENT